MLANCTFFSATSETFRAFPGISETLSSFNTSPIQVAKLCRDIKKSNSSHCGIPGKFLSLISTPISFPLSRLYNNLFEIGHFQNLSHHSLIQGIRSKIRQRKLQKDTFAAHSQQSCRVCNACQTFQTLYFK